jgi:hypothetical protein
VGTVSTVGLGAVTVSTSVWGELNMVLNHDCFGHLGMQDAPGHFFVSTCLPVPRGAGSCHQIGRASESDP